MHARKILNDISSGGGAGDKCALIGKYLQGRLERAVGHIIDLLKVKKVAALSELGGHEEFKTTARIDVSSEAISGLGLENINERMDETKELLKLASGVQNLKDLNICK